jgi:sulfonate transport system permease protein
MSDTGIGASLLRETDLASPASRRAPRLSSNARRVAVRVASTAACVLLWHVCASHKLDLGIVDFRNVPPPGDVLEASVQFIRSTKFLFHVRSSLLRVTAGLALASLSGVALGLAMGRSKLVSDVASGPLELLRPIPAVAWVPLAILMFPSSELSMIFITYVGALFPIVLNTIHGVESIDGRLIDVSRSLGASNRSIFLEVILPGAMPSIVTGVSIGTGTAWFCLVTAEMIAGQYGIGYYTWESYNLQIYPNIVVGMVFIGVFGLLSSVLVKRMGGWLMPWERVGYKAS